MSIEDQIKAGPKKVKIIKPLDMGFKSHSDICEFVSPEFLTIEEDDGVFIKADQIVTAIYSKVNGLIELSFSDNTSSYDVIFEEEDPIEKYLEIIEEA